MGIMENLTYDQFKEFLKNNKLAMATFGAPWCGACRSLGPIVEEIIGEVKDGIAILKVNVDESPELPGKLGIQSIPTMIFFKDGVEVNRSVGMTQKSAILKNIDALKNNN